MRSGNHIEAEICCSHFHFLVWKSFPIDVQKFFVFCPSIKKKFSNACQVMNSRHGSMVQGSQKRISLPFWKKFDTLDIKLYDCAFRIFHWIHCFFQCSTFTCQQKFCHFSSGNIFQNNSVENCFAITIFYHNVSTDSIDVVTGYMTLWVSLVVIFERPRVQSKVNHSWDWLPQHLEMVRQFFSNHLFQPPRLRYDRQIKVDWQCLQLLI